MMSIIDWTDKIFIISSLVIIPTLRVIIFPVLHTDAQVTTNFECNLDGCCDQHEWCKFWAGIGECDGNSNWMPNNCRISCHTCAGVSDANGDHETTPTGVERPGGQKPSSDQPSAFRNSIPVENAAQRCMDILLTPNNTAAVRLMKSENLVVDHEDNSFKKPLSVGDIFSHNKKEGCAPVQQSHAPQDCVRNACYHALYRTMDGTCNNLDEPLRGASATPVLRLKRPSYDDGVSAPTGSTKGGLPSAREASRFMLSSNQLVTNDKWNMLLMQFGQFIVHDMTKTSLLPPDTCTSSGCQDVPGKCFPIKVETTDPRFGSCSSPPCCLSFTRSAPVCNSSPRNQLNEQTSFIDGSQIYGFSVPDSNRLRDGAQLKSTAFNSKMYLPFNQQTCSGPTSCPANFDAGDNRITIFVGLVAFHTLFLREHNRLVEKLQQINPHWGKDRIYEESRKIVGAELQSIIYKEWLPKIMGDRMNTVIGPYQGYNKSVDPSVTDYFTFGAMRFGHGMIQESYSRLDANNKAIPEGSMKFDDGILKPSKLLFEGGLDPVLRGFMNMAVKRPQRLTTALTERMFGTTDLAAINIQRARDAGLPSYNEWRDFCKLKKAVKFEDMASEISDPTVRSNLEQGFETPDNVDLYVGAIIEDPVPNGMVGPTITCLIGDQFRRVRDGDRFWYQNPGVFAPDQLAELEKVRFSRIICDNSDEFRTISLDAFEFSNSTTTGTNSESCSKIPSIDLSKWADQ